MPSKITSRVVWTSKEEQRKAHKRAERIGKKNFSAYIRGLVESDLEDEGIVHAITGR